MRMALVVEILSHGGKGTVDATVNIMTVGDLETQETRASAAMVLTKIF